MAVVLPEALHLPRILQSLPGLALSSTFISHLSLISTEFAFCQVDASIALDLALVVLCDLLQQWDQLAPGLPVLLGWLLEEGDDLPVCVESEHQVVLGSQGSGGEVGVS